MSTSNFGLVTREEKLWGLLAHVFGFAGYLFALGQYVAPLVLFFLYKDKSKFVAFHALQSLLFQLLVLAAFSVSWFLTHFVIGYLLLPLVGLAGIAFPILAAKHAFHGEWYEYPLVGKWARSIIDR